jgi:general secretion pathway protein G
MKRGFTMIELVFVIIVLGILASVAVPRLVGNRDDAEIVKAKTVVSSVRSGIAIKHQELLMSGSNTYPTSLTSENGGGLFDIVLNSPVKSDKWKQTSGEETYTFTLGSRSATYKYYVTKPESGERKAGDFYCDSGDLCDILDK